MRLENDRGGAEEGRPATQEQACRHPASGANTTGSAAAPSARVDPTEARGFATIVENGVLAGIAGALVVALWFLVIDTARGQHHVWITVVFSSPLRKWFEWVVWEIVLPICP